MATPVPSPKVAPPAPAQYVVGDPVPLPTDWNRTNAPLAVLGPDGSTRPLPAGTTNFTQALAPGIYRYIPAKHGLQRIVAGDQQAAAAGAAGGQASVASAPLTLVFTAVASRISPRPDARVDRFVAVEVGAAAQNVYLQATSLGLGTVIVGGVNADAMARLLQLTGADAPQPIIAMPVGKRQG